MPVTGLPKSLTRIYYLLVVFCCLDEGLSECKVWFWILRGRSAACEVKLAAAQRKAKQRREIIVYLSFGEQNSVSSSPPHNTLN